MLYIGDHIYGDMLRAKKSSIWRTAMILQELEHEITTHDLLKQRADAAGSPGAELVHLDSELNERQAALRALQKLSAEGADGAADRSPSAR